MTPNPEAEAWLQKLEQWLRDNHSLDIIYVINVAHRSGMSATVTNVDGDSALWILKKNVKKLEKELMQ